MRPAGPRGWRLAATLALVVVIASAFSVWALVEAPTATPPSFHAVLLPLTVGSLGSFDGKAEYFADLGLNYSSPSAIGASALVLTITAPGNESIILPNGSAVRSIEVTYGLGTYPPWLVHLTGPEIWGGFSMTATNPDGSAVNLPGGPPVTSIQPGALLNLSFPIGTSPAGFSVTANVAGYLGGASCGLRLPPGATSP